MNGQPGRDGAICPVRLQFDHVGAVAAEAEAALRIGVRVRARHFVGEHALEQHDTRTRDRVAGLILDPALDPAVIMPRDIDIPCRNRDRDHQWHQHEAAAQPTRKSLWPSAAISMTRHDAYEPLHQDTSPLWRRR